MTAHDDLRAVVAALAAGESTDTELAERHLRECEECRLWMDSYDAFAAALIAHPTSETLAELAVQPAHGGDEDRELLQHLEACDSCRQELELTRAALAHAGRDESAERPERQRSVLAWAAVLVAVLGLGFVLQRQSPERDFVELTEQSIGGSRVIEAPVALMAGDSKLLDGSKVTLSARELVAFGDGFSVGSDAILVVETGGSGQ